MTMTNAEWMIKNGHKFSELDVKCLGLERGCRIAINGKTVEKVPLVNMVSAIICWLDEEHIDPILDDVEHQYLSAVIKPFRKHVQNIAKYLTFGNTEEYIIIQIDSSERVYFPRFKADTMYKGMEPGHKYTLEELGL